MRTLVLPLLFVLFVSQALMAQIKIGDNPQNLDPASVLELESTERVLVITRIDSLQMNAIVPQRGALVYNTDANCVHYFDGTAWRSLCETAENGVTANPIVNETATIVITPDAGNFNVEIAPSSISTEHIADGGINGIDLQNNSIGGNKLANTSVTRPKLSENAVGVTELATDEIDLALFENGTGFIRDDEVVSSAAGNVITNNAGAFYDDSALQSAIATNTANIAADGDTNSANELQILEITGDQLTISGRNTITLPTADGSDTNINAGANIVIGGNGTAGTPYVISADDEVDGSITNELQDLAFDVVSNILTISNPATTGNQVNLSSLAGGGGTTEVADGVTITGDGQTVATGFQVADEGISLAKIQPLTPAPATSQMLITDVLGDVTWAPVPTGGGGGTTEEADGVTITGVGTNADPFTIAPGTDGQFLTTDATNNVVWTTVIPGGGGTTEVADGVTITGDGQTVATGFQVADGGISLAKIAPSTPTPATDQMLITNTTGAVIWAPVPTGGGGGGTTEVADGVTITGDGQTVATGFQVADDGINSTQIADGTITSDDILDGTLLETDLAPGDADQILQTDATGTTVAWVDLPAGNTEVDGTTIAGAGIVGDPLTITPGPDGQFLNTTGGVVGWANLPGGVGGTVETDGITLEGNGVAPNILQVRNGGITAIKLNQMGATDGQILKWDTATTAWVVANDESGTPTLADGNIFVGNALGEPTEVAVNGEATIDNTGLLTIAADAVTTVKILDNNVTVDKIAEGTDGQILTTNATGDVVWAPPTAAAVLTDITSITGTGLVGAELAVAPSAITSAEIADGTITDADIAAGGADQILQTDATGTAVGWVDFPGATGVLTDPASITGTGLTGAELAVAPNAITAAEITDGTIMDADIAAGGADQILRTNAAGTAVTWVDFPGATGVLTDPASITGTGLVGAELAVAPNAIASDEILDETILSDDILDGTIVEADIADDAVTTVKILDNNVTIEKINAGADGQILRTIGTDVVWGDPAPTGVLTDPTSITGTGILGAELAVAANAITSAEIENETILSEDILDDTIAEEDIADDAITSAKIDDATITAADLSALGATTNGQVLKWNGTTWAADTDLTGSSVTDTDVADGLSDFDATTGYNINVDGITISLNGDFLEVPDGAITSTKIDDASIIADDIAPDAIGIDALQDDSVGTDELINEAVTVEKIAPGVNRDMLVTIGGVTSWESVDDYVSDDDQEAPDVDMFPSWDVDGDGFNENNVQEAIQDLTIALALDNDTSATNEIQDISSSDGSLTITPSGDDYDITVASISGGVGGSIAANSISQGDIGNNAIGAAEIQSGVVSSDEITDGSIVNVDISAGAAIDGSKIAPAFTQGITTTGGLSVQDDILLNGNVVVPDYVFQTYFLGNSKLDISYKFSNLSAVENFIKKYHHLPGIKSAAQVKKDGYWNLSESNLQNLEKIEELYLHTINQEKEIEKLKTQNQTLSTELETLKKDMAEIKALLKK